MHKVSNAGTQDNKPELRSWMAIRAFSTTETLSTTERTDFPLANGQRTFPGFINIVSDLSGSQCFSGFTAGILESTSNFGINDPHGITDRNPFFFTEKFPTACGGGGNGRDGLPRRSHLSAAGGESLFRKHPVVAKKFQPPTAVFLFCREHPCADRHSEAGAGVSHSGARWPSTP